MKAIKIDPDFSDPFAGLSWTYQREILLETAVDRRYCEEEALRLARRAVELDDGSSFAHHSLSSTFIWSRPARAVEFTGNAPRSAT